MNDKKIFITGAASGIGLETAKLFAQRGWFVGITDLNEKGLRSLEAEIGNNNCFSSVLDVTEQSAYMKVIETFTKRTGGKIDVLFNNAGILRMGKNESISLADQHMTIDTNIKGILNGIYCALEYLKKTPRSRIISMASTSALYGIPEMAVYSASKHAVCALTEALDLEFEAYDITVSDIIVPFVKTPMVTAAEKKARSMDTLSARIEPYKVAETVWKAAHGQKLHWKIHFITYLMITTLWTLPAIRRAIVRFLCMSPNL
jgi:NADP-dependent 3-hydroxy acid dehydrogenase YdfG